LRIHLGCGPDIRPEWINIDLNTSLRSALLPSVPTGGRFINYDLRRGLPLQANCARIVFSSHFFEHLDYPHGLNLMEDCFRVLESGGTFRIVLPDFKRMSEKYQQGDREFFELIDQLIRPIVDPKTLTMADYVNYWVYQFGEHKFIYDQEKLDVVLRHIGFSQVRTSQFDPSIDVDTPTRRKYSFFTEAIK
jgi:predicted SAM-dependent methyltransferase